MRNGFALAVMWGSLFSPFSVSAEDIATEMKDPSFSTFIKLPSNVNRDTDLVLDVVRETDGDLADISIENFAEIAKRADQIICIPGKGCRRVGAGGGGTLSVEEPLLVQVLPQISTEEAETKGELTLGITDFSTGAFEQITVPGFTVDDNGGIQLEAQ